MKMSNYWFYLDSYTFVDFKENSVVLYNTLSGDIYESSDDTIFKLTERLYLDTNNGVCLITAEEFQNYIIVNFIDTIRDYYMGDIIPAISKEKKPIQFYPILNLQSDIRKIAKDETVIDKVDLSLLSHIIIHLNSDCKYKCNHCGYAYKQTLHCTQTIHKGKELELTILKDAFRRKELRGLRKISIIGGDIMSYKHLKAIAAWLKNMDCIVEWNFHAKQILRVKDLSIVACKNMFIRIKFDSSVKKDDIETIYHTLEARNIRFYIDMMIENEEDLFYYDLYLCPMIKSENKIILQPLYNEENGSFFKDHIYLNREDILIKKQSMQEVFAKQVLNRIDFGKMHILPDGEVYANLNMQSLGNINADSLEAMLLRELSERNTWLRVRANKPCTTCLYQWLCPSPTNYELIIGRPNLCHIKP